MSTAFEAWKDRAREADILDAAIRHGATLKRFGGEYCGPCPNCGGRDRFSVSPAKRKWNCRGAVGGGDPIGLVMHVSGLSFMEACEDLTGEPNPDGGRSQPISDDLKRERESKRLASQARQRAREAQAEAYRGNTRETARAIWDASSPLCGSLGANYLNSRGIPTPAAWPECLRFNPGLSYPGKPGRYPALIGRVDDACGDLTAIWRIYLRSDARKMDVDNPKLGLGPAGGGAVRIGGIGPKVAVAEGIESALGYWMLIGMKHPVWAALSTSGMQGLRVPAGVLDVSIAPDGDRPFKRNKGEYVESVPPGRVAARTLHDRLIREGIRCAIVPEPKPGTDYLDVWRNHARGE